MRYVEEPLRSTTSLSSIQVSDQASNKSPASLPQVRSATGKLIIGDVYEMCDSATPESAAEHALKNRGPPPKIPAPYHKSRSLDRNARHNVSPHRNFSTSDLESSPGSPLLQASSSGILKPPPRRKYSIHKPSAIKQQLKT